MKNGLIDEVSPKCPSSLCYCQTLDQPRKLGVSQGLPQSRKMIGDFANSAWKRPCLRRAGISLWEVLLPVSAQHPCRAVLSPLIEGQEKKHKFSS